MTLPWLTVYSASKYALGSLTEGLRMELRGDGVRAMLVCPGYVQTGFQKNVHRRPGAGQGARRAAVRDYRRRLRARHPPRRGARCAHRADAAFRLVPGGGHAAVSRRLWKGDMAEMNGTA